MRTRLLLCLLLTLSIAGCKAKKPAVAEERYPIEGRVVAVTPAEKTITLDHKDIPGYMKGMTMPFPVRDAWVFNVVHPGDTVHATLVVGESDWLENISVNQSGEQAEQSNTAPAQTPKVGDRVPDLKFVDQQGRQRHLSDLRGQPVLVTFIYTRCPLPDFCIRMSSNFASVASLMKASNPAAYARLQMLSITLDPDFDTPKVLASYAKRYAGTADPELKHWSFVAPSSSDLHDFAGFFGMSYAAQNGQIIHNLRTAIITPDGRLAEFYTGNQWKPEEVAARLAQLQK